MTEKFKDILRDLQELSATFDTAGYPHMIMLTEVQPDSTHAHLALVGNLSAPQIEVLITALRAQQTKLNASQN